MFVKQVVVSVETCPNYSILNCSLSLTFPSETLPVTSFSFPAQILTLDCKHLTNSPTAGQSPASCRPVDHQCQGLHATVFYQRFVSAFYIHRNPVHSPRFYFVCSIA